jgi:hypothetical protein
LAAMLLILKVSLGGYSTHHFEEMSQLLDSALHLGGQWILLLDSFL